jgi:hypothetical protein
MFTMYRAARGTFNFAARSDRVWTSARETVRIMMGMSGNMANKAKQAALQLKQLPSEEIIIKRLERNECK